MENIANILSQWVVKNRRLSIALCLIIALLTGIGTKNLGFTNDYRVFFHKDDPQLIAYDKLQKTYTKADNVLIALAPKDGVVFKRSTLAAIKDITERAWQAPYSSRVDSLANYQHTQADGDDLLVGDLYDDAEYLSATQITRIKNIAVTEPLLLHRLISSDADITAVNVTYEFAEGDETAQELEAVTHIRELKEYIVQTYPDLSPYLTGVIMLNNTFYESSEYDASHIIPVAALLILALVYLQLRSFSGTVGTLITILLSIISALGITGWMGIKMSPPSMSAPTIILTLAVADCVHILANFISNLRNGLEKQKAMIESVRINFVPVLLTSLTTALGFLTLNFSESQTFRDLGNISAMGVMFAWLYAMFFLPAFVSLLPIKVKAETSFGTVTMNRFADWVVNKRKLLLPLISLIILITIAFIPKNEVNDIFVQFFDERVEFRADTDYVVDNLTGMYNIEYSLDSKESGGISNPSFLAQTDRFTNWLKAQPEVMHVDTITDVFKRLNKSMHGDDPNWYKLPENRDEAAQYLLLYEMSLPYGLDMTNQIDIDKQHTRVIPTLETISTTQAIEFERRTTDWLQKNTPEINAVGSGTLMMFTHMTRRNITGMLIGTLVALIAMSIVLTISFKSWRYGLLSLVPNVAPASMAFGVWALIDGEIGIGLSVTAAITLGIVVDATIHYISKYLRARNEKGLDAIHAVKYAFSTVGVAIWTTSIALIVGFLVLSTSFFELNSKMGLLVALIIALALIIDFLLLPPLLIKFDGWLEKDRNSIKVKQ